MIPRSRPPPGRVRAGPRRVGGDGDLGGHVDPQAAPRRTRRVTDRTCSGGVGQVPVQADPQRRASPRRPAAAAPPVEGERAVVPADRHSARRRRGNRADRVTGLAAFRPRRTRRRSSGAAPTARRPCPARRRCPARTRPVPGTAPGRPPAAGRGGAAAMVELQHARPDVHGGAQQREAPVPLGPGGRAASPGGAMHHAGRVRVTTSRHADTQAQGYDRNPGQRSWTLAGCGKWRW